MNDMSEAPATPSLADLAIELESARAAHASAKADFESAKERVRFTGEGERTAYKAFNDAVAAMKPKRKPSEKKSGEPKAPKASKPKK